MEPKPSTNGSYPTIISRLRSQSPSLQFSLLSRDEPKSFLNLDVVKNSQMPASPSNSERINAQRALCQARCRKLLDKLGDGDDVRLDQQFLNIIEYKGHQLSGSLLHYAVYHVAEGEDPNASGVRQILERKGDVRATAVYYKGKVRTDLQAIHIAAGLGCVPAMRALLEYVEKSERRNFLNTYCTQWHMLEDGDSQAHSKQYYAPIHDAAYLGQKDSLVWLLDHKADPTLENIDNYTPLHWLVSNGRSSEKDTKTMVKSLVKHKARLDVRAKPKGCDVPSTPLEMAVSPGSKFPVQLTYLLAPSFQDPAGRSAGMGYGDAGASFDTIRSYSLASSEHEDIHLKDVSFFDDLCMLANLNIQAAEGLAHQIVTSEDPRVEKKVRLDAQKEGAADCIAGLFYAAPQAAVEMLHILTVRPWVKMPKYPISSRAKMDSFFGNVSMRCSYQTDISESLYKSHKKEGTPEWTYSGLKWPEWRCIVDSEHGELEKPWQLELVRKPSKGEERSEHINDVDTKVILLPNILDVDVVMALACVRQRHYEIYSTLQVQATITCLWDHLVESAFRLALFFDALELLAMICWGLAREDSSSAKDNSEAWHLWSLATFQDVSHDNSPVCMPIMHTIILTGVLRDVSNLLWWFIVHCKKWRAHHQRFEAWKQHFEHDHRPPFLHSLWSPWTFLSHTSAFPELIFCIFRVAFLCMIHVDLSRPCDGRRMNDLQQALLAIATIVQFAKFMYSFRGTSVGRRIIPILFMFQDITVLEILFLTSVFFFIVYIAFMMMHRSGSAVWIMLYRGLFFGDGDGLDTLGFDENHDQGFKVGFMVLATIFFNVMALNLTIAVFSSQYEHLKKQGELLFQKERAKACCKYMLGHLKLAHSVPTRAFSRRLGFLRLAVCLTLILAAACSWALHHGFVSTSLRDIAGRVTVLLLTVFHISLQELLMQLNWSMVAGTAGSFDVGEDDATDTSNGVKSNDEEAPTSSNSARGPADVQPSIGLGRSKDNFLWFCHPAEYRDDATSRPVDESRLHRYTSSLIDGKLLEVQTRDVQERVDRMEDKVEAKLSKLEDKVDKLLVNLGSFLGQRGQGSSPGLTPASLVRVSPRVSFKN